MINDPIPPLQMATVQGLWTIQLLVTSSLITATFHKYMDKGKRSRSVCTVWDDRNSDFTCNQLIVGVVSMNKKNYRRSDMRKGQSTKSSYSNKWFVFAIKNFPATRVQLTILKIIWQFI